MTHCDGRKRRSRSNSKSCGVRERCHVLNRATASVRSNSCGVTEHILLACRNGEARKQLRHRRRHAARSRRSQHSPLLLLREDNRQDGQPITFAVAFTYEGDERSAAATVSCWLVSSDWRLGGLWRGEEAGAELKREEHERRRGSRKECEVNPS